MKIVFFKPKELDSNVKATLHASGKLGFSSAARNKLKLEEGKYLALGRNEDDLNDQNLYGVLYEEENEFAFRVQKAGDYYYVNTKSLFDSLGYDYKRTKFIYDINKIQTDDGDVLRFTRRELRKKKKENEDL